jgi:hypothetical protein
MGGCPPGSVKRALIWQRFFQLSFWIAQRIAPTRLQEHNLAQCSAWTTPRGVRRYYNLLLNQERMFLELVGGHGGDAYSDYQHLDDGIPFALMEGTTYAISVAIGERRLAARVMSPNGHWCYSAALPEDLLGRVGLRPWRSRVECEKFVIRGV